MTRHSPLFHHSALTLMGSLALGCAGAVIAQPADESSPTPEATAQPTQANQTASAESASSGAITASATVTGSGTTGRIPRWTGASTLGSLALVQSNGNIGIGHTAPPSKLTVDGSDASQATIRAPVR